MFAKNLKNLISGSGQTQTEIAAALNLSPQRLSMYSTGVRCPDYDLLLKIADYFNVTVDYLLGRSSAPAPELLVHSRAPARYDELDHTDREKVDCFIQGLLEADKYAKIKEKGIL